jgi:hypothetical protein
MHLRGVAKRALMTHPMARRWLQGCRPEDLPPDLLHAVAELMTGDDGMMVQVSTWQLLAMWPPAGCCTGLLPGPPRARLLSSGVPAAWPLAGAPLLSVWVSPGTQCSRRVRGWLCLQAFLRAGCVQLVFEARQRNQQQPEIGQQLAQMLGRHMAGRRVLVQQGPRASIVANGEVLAAWQLRV